VESAYLTSVLRNEARWEAHLIEGPFIRRRGDWFYLFYSADGCCGRTCNYKLGVARARALLGPWERDPANPILEGNHDWKCPGHGSIVTTPDGRDYLLYHAYDPDAFQFVGRQGLLDAVTWGADGWPAINAGNGPSDRAVAPLGISPRERSREFLDELTGPALQLGWQWPWDHTPSRRFVAGTLALRTSTRSTGSAVDTIIARSTRSGNYTATARLVESRASDDGMAGLAAYGDAENAIGISRIGSNVVVWIREKGAQRSLASAAIGDGPSLELRIIATRGRRFQFAYSPNGREWHALGEEAEGGYLPPWDRAVRIALAVGGPPAVDARFDWLRIETR
jgi:beta-xylosidase